MHVFVRIEQVHTARLDVEVKARDLGGSKGGGVDGTASVWCQYGVVRDGTSMETREISRFFSPQNHLGGDLPINPFIGLHADHQLVRRTPSKRRDHSWDLVKAYSDLDLALIQRLEGWWMVGGERWMVGGGRWMVGGGQWAVGGGWWAVGGGR